IWCRRKKRSPRNGARRRPRNSSITRARDAGVAMGGRNRACATRRSSSTIRPQARESSMTMQHDDSTTRGAGLAAAPGVAAVAASTPARAQQPRAKGPLVWLDMDQQALDDAYDQIVYAPNREQVTKRRIANNERARAAIGAPERVAYGATEIEK